jgi:hypothetical protein
LVVVARQHAPEVWEHLDKIHWGQTILQPRNCGTAPGIFLPLAHIYAKDAEAIVLIIPSDHFVFPEAGFLTALQRVVATAQRLPDKLVLLGARADSQKPNTVGSCLARLSTRWMATSFAQSKAFGKSPTALTPKLSSPLEVFGTPW